MSTSLVRAGANALAAYGGVNPFAEAGKGAETGDYLKFNGNTGEITYGADDIVLPVGSYLVADLNSYAQGHICWKDSEAVEEILIPILEGKPPREADLTDHGPYDDPDDGWREAGSIPFVIFEHLGDPDGDPATHEDVGKNLLFKTSTGGAVRALKKLSLAYSRQFMSKPGQLPVIEITTDEYTPKNKKHGKKHAINFKIVGWVTEEEMAGIAQAPGESDDDYEPEPAPVEKAPARRSRAAAPVEDEQEEAPAAPARRGRAAAPAPEPEDAQEEAPAAPARRGRAAPAAEPEVAAEDEDDGNVAPVARGRSPGRGAPPANARVRRFA